MRSLPLIRPHPIGETGDVPMLKDDVHPESANAVFHRKFREKLVARGYRGADLDRKVEELMSAPVRFRFDLSEDPPPDEIRIQFEGGSR
jgi:hypothetical protein